MNAVQPHTSGTAVANTDAYNAYSAYAAEASNRTIVGALLKFSKGEWTKGQNDVVVPLGSKFVADMRNVQVGWTRWENKKPVEHAMGRIADGFRPAARASLGFNNKDEWEVDAKDGKSQDPWQNTSILFLMDQNGDIFTYSPSSAGGRNAVIALCGGFGKLMRQHPGELPVVEIGVDSYRHETYGKTFTPVLKIVGWHSEKDFDEAQEAEAADAKAREEQDAPAQQQVTQQQAAPVQAPPVQQAAPVQEAVQQPAPAPAADAGFGFKKGAGANKARF